MTTSPPKLPPLVRAPVDPAGRPGVSALPPLDTPGTNPPPSATPRAEGGAQTPAGSLHTQCPLSAGHLLMAARMPEDKGDDSVEAHLRWYLSEKHGYGIDLAYHAWRQHARKAKEGWPDWAITGPGGAMIRELKRQDEDPTPIQERWLLSLRAAGWDADVWKPCCILSGRMSRELAAIARIGGAR